MQQQRVSAIVLAGGRSSRYGSDKLAATVAGRPLLHLAVSAAAMVADEVVVVIAADRDPSLPKVAVALRTIIDSEPYGGPLAGLRDGAAAAAHPTILVIGGDMPALRPAVLRLLVDAVQSGRVAAVLDADPGSGRRQTLPLAVARDPARAAAMRLVLGGERSLRALLDALDTAIVPAATWRLFDPAGETLRDVDRLEDLPGGARPDLTRPAGRRPT